MTHPEYSSQLQTRRSESRWVTSARLLSSPPAPDCPGAAELGSDRLDTMMVTESERSRAAESLPSRLASTARCVRCTAVRKIDRKVSVSIAASTANWNAGRKFTAFWFPALASSWVRRSASSRRTSGSSSMATERSANESLL